MCLFYLQSRWATEGPKADQKRAPIALLIPCKKPQAFYFTPPVLIKDNAKLCSISIPLYFSRQLEQDLPYMICPF